MIFKFHLIKKVTIEILFHLHFRITKVNQQEISARKRQEGQAIRDKNSPPSPPGQPTILLLYQDSMTAGASYEYSKQKMLRNSFKDT